ncbi:MAG: acetate kinase [Candidatus Cloacimonadota bacterium]|nr:MAG: acetate kinase [Candidatus Cloacimonadota bacterium]
MRVLTLNCGSSSIKFQFINVETEDVMAEGSVERIGEETGLFTYKSEKYTAKKQKTVIEDHSKGIQMIIDNLMNPDHGQISDESGIDAVGHRLVHGGEYFSKSVVINDEVMKVLHDCIDLAPLHNPANIMGVKAVTEYLPNIPQCGVFDTAFHQTMPPRAYLYGLPLEMYEKHQIRRYGFHGTSHKFVSKLAAEHVGKDIKDLKIITCHIGNGASVTAVKNGESIDTSMGFTPLEGLVMGTRCGDLDPQIPLHLIKNLGMTADEVNTLLNKKSGMAGISTISNDMREIETEILEHKNEKAIQAHEVYAYRIKKYIGAYAAAMNGLDILVFTGGVGENMPILRSLVCKDLDFFGIKLNEEQNAQFKGGTIELHADDSKVAVLKIQTNEELMIAMETKALLK